MTLNPRKPADADLLHFHQESALPVLVGDEEAYTIPEGKRVQKNDYELLVVEIKCDMNLSKHRVA